MQSSRTEVASILLDPFGRDGAAGGLKSQNSSHRSVGGHEAEPFKLQVFEDTSGPGSGESWSWLFIWLVLMDSMSVVADCLEYVAPEARLKAPNCQRNKWKDCSVRKLGPKKGQLSSKSGSTLMHQGAART